VRLLKLVFGGFNRGEYLPEILDWSIYSTNFYQMLFDND